MNMFMKRISALVLAVVCLSGVSCVRHETEAAEEYVVHYSFSIDQHRSKSIIPSTMESRRKTVSIYIVDNDSPTLWKVYHLSGTKAESPLETTLMKGHSYTVYALVNMGEAILPKTAGGELDVSRFEYRIPSFDVLPTDGIPMAGQMLVSRENVLEGGISTIIVERLMAKITVAVDHSGITGGLDGAGVRNSSVYMRNVANLVRPFAPEDRRKALSTADIFGGDTGHSTDTDYDVFAASTSMDNESETLTFYVPENRQGQLTGFSEQRYKSEEYILEAPLCTYVEFNAVKDGSADGVGGNVKYRYYIGANDWNEFSVRRNEIYPIRLLLTWDGLFLDHDWRIDNSDLSDSRRLRLSAVPSTLDDSFSDLGRINRNATSSVYVSFTRDLGSTWVNSAKDMDGWPFGWDFYLDGVKQPSGLSATAAGDLAWAYTGAASGDRISITPGPSAVFNSDHTLQVKSVDGKVVSNIVAFKVGQPLEFSWYMDRAPQYIAQQGTLAVNGASGSPVYTYEITSGADVIRFAAPPSGAIAAVQAIGEGSATVKVTTSNGQEGEFDIEVASPKVVQAWNARDLWVDGTATTSAFRYTNAGGTAMTVAASDEGGYGTRFAPSLYEEFLKPTISSTYPGTLKQLLDMDGNGICVKTLKASSTVQIGTAPFVFDGTDMGVTVKHGSAKNSGGLPLTTTYSVTLKNPFTDADKADLDVMFHDFTTMYDHLTASQKGTYSASKSYTFSSNASGKLYASPENILAQTTSDIGSNLDNLFVDYTAGARTVRISMGNTSGGNYRHPSGGQSVYLHVRNKYDVASGDETRKKLSLSKKIGSAQIYLHVAWATFVEDCGGYIDDFSIQSQYRKNSESSLWTVKYFWGGFLDHVHVISNSEVYNLANYTNLGSAFFNTARTDRMGFSTGTAPYILTDPYGFIANSGSNRSGIYKVNGYKGIGFALMYTYNAGGSHLTCTWDQWRTNVPGGGSGLASVTAPFCYYKPSYAYTTNYWSGNGLSGYYYTVPGHPQDGNDKGYVILHFLQDLPVNPGFGFVE